MRFFKAANAFIFCQGREDHFFLSYKALKFFPFLFNSFYEVMPKYLVLRAGLNGILFWGAGAKVYPV